MISLQRLAIEISRNPVTATRVTSGPSVSALASLNVQQQPQNQAAGDAILNLNSSRTLENYHTSMGSASTPTRSVQNLLPNGSDGSNASPLVPLCDLTDVAGIRPLGSASTLSSISSKASSKHQRAGIPSASNEPISPTSNSIALAGCAAGNCQALGPQTPSPTHSSPTMLRDIQNLNIPSSSSSSSDSGVSVHYLS